MRRYIVPPLLSLEPSSVTLMSLNATWPLDWLRRPLHVHVIIEIDGSKRYVRCCCCAKIPRTHTIEKKTSTATMKYAGGCCLNPTQPAKPSPTAERKRTISINQGESSYSTEPFGRRFMYSISETARRKTQGAARRRHE